MEEVKGKGWQCVSVVSDAPFEYEAGGVVREANSNGIWSQ